MLQKTDKNRNELSTFKEVDTHKKGVWKNMIYVLIIIKQSLHVNSSISTTHSYRLSLECEVKSFSFNYQNFGSHKREINNYL